MKTILILLTLNVVWSTVQADRDSDEYRLLKTWGMQFDTQGKLRFRPEENKTSQYNPWNPDLSAYQSINANQEKPEILQPLVISSRNQPQIKEKNKAIK